MDTQGVVYLAAESVVGVATLVGNLWVGVAIVRTTRLHTPPNVFIAFLALADLLVRLFFPFWGFNKCVWIPCIE